MRVVTQLLFFGMVGATADTFEWKLGRPTCPSACGKLETTIQLPLKCIKKTRYDPEGSPVASSFCDQYEKPDTNYRCPPTPPCAPRWWTSDVNCPTYCGLLQSQQPRDVLCKGKVGDTIITISDSYCNQYTKPSSTVTCRATSPCEPYWYTSPVTCPTDCGCDASRPPRTVVCKGKVNNVEAVIAESYCPRPKPPPYVQCTATPPCAPICTANQRPCECDEDCCSGICELPNSKPSKSSTNGKHRKAEASKDTKDSKGTKDTKDTKDSKGTKDNPGKCVCRTSGAACTKDAECCYGRCKNYKCAASRRSFVETFAPLSHNAGVAAALGAGAAVGLGVILAVGVVRRRRRSAKIASAQVDYVVA